MSLVLKDDRRTIRAWTFYDWANSVFPLVITSAIFPNFYDAVTSTKNEAGEIVSHTVSFFGHHFENQNLYSFMYAFALSIVVIIAPILSGIADYLGNKKRFLQFFCYLGAISCMCLFFFKKERIELSFLPFITATIGFWGSLVYYNSYLPEIASKENQDKVSARGFALGYFGSSLLLIICLVFIMSKTFFHLLGDADQYKGIDARIAFLLVGLWWIGFAQYTFSVLPSITHKGEGLNKSHIFSKGFRELRGVAKQVFALPIMRRFLGAYFFYNMGVQTVMVVAVLFARNEVIWANEEAKTSSLIVSILIIQFVGILGSFVFSRLSTISGNVRALMVAVGIWIFICVFTYWQVYHPWQFYIVAFLVGFVMGGIQSLSRSTYSKLIPGNEDLASFFSFFDVMEKLGMILGTITFGIISEIMGGMRPSVLSLIVFFIIGFILLVTLQRRSALAATAG
jgi:UMF1 family MFS transporter